MKNKEYNKRIDKGEKLYDDFVYRLSVEFGMSSVISTPRTGELEKYALLKKTFNDKGVLYQEMMREYLSNFEDFKIFADKGSLWQPITNNVRL